MKKPLSNFLKAPAQNNDGSLPVVTAESEAHTADNSIVHTETEYIAADAAVLCAEPMMTTPLEVKSVPVEPVVVRPELIHFDAAKPVAAAAEQVEVPVVVEAEKVQEIAEPSAPVTHIVARAKVAAVKSLATGFKPAMNVKPSAFMPQEKTVEIPVAKAAEPVVNEPVIEPVVQQVKQAEPETAPIAIQTAEQPVEIEVEASETAAAKVAVEEAVERPSETVAEAAVKTEVKAIETEAPAVQVAAAVSEQRKPAFNPETVVTAPAAVPASARAKGKAAVFKSAVKPIRAAISALPALPAVAAVGRFWQNKPVRWSILGVLLPVSGMVAAYAVNEPQPEKDLYRAERVMEELPPVYVESGIVNGSYWAQEAVQPGDSLTDVLFRIGVSEENIRQVLVHSSIDRDLIQLRAGQSVNVRFDASGDVTDVQFFNDDDNGFRDLVAIEKVNGKWGTSTSAIDMETMPTLRSVQVRTSARGALAQAGVPVEIRESLSEIFTDVVNVEELSEGDSIRLLYNSMYFRGQEMATGDILAAEVVKDGKTYQAYYYSQGKGDEESGSYYDQHGKALHSTDGFNVKPVEYTRISSPYGMRVHPVLHTVKMHTGIDYAAATGTPIRATADGTLTFKGWKGGYGNTVVLTHSNGIETLYAHMSAFSPAEGKVKAGEVIGYVGSTGRSTGPHLHYEVRKNGQHMNPTAIALPTPKLTPTNMAEFRKQQETHSATLAAVRNLPVAVTQLD